MFYVFPITIAANTAFSARTQTFVRVDPFIIHDVQIQFPPGCVGLVNVRLFDGGHQFAPTNSNQAYTSDDETVQYKEWYEVQAGGTIVIEAWNTDDTFAHTVTVRIGVLEEDKLQPQFATKGWLSSLGALFSGRRR